MPWRRNGHRSAATSTLALAVQNRRGDSRRAAVGDEKGLRDIAWAAAKQHLPAAIAVGLMVLAAAWVLRRRG
ncbi:MAG: hypothetical protein DCC67_10430 [Planctomycetota bacterium]|nr:MAG: hypothetical protein DCC67_10430 [Planctomycetota bacterium]